MLSAVEVNAIALRDVIPANTGDLDLFDYLANNKPIALVSTDKSQLRKEVEMRKLKSIKVTAVYIEPFWTKKLILWSQAEWMVKNWPMIESWVESSVTGSFGSVKQRGRIESIRI